jgi:signal transduction histidine kinase
VRRLLRGFCLALASAATLLPCGALAAGPATARLEINTARAVVDDNAAVPQQVDFGAARDTALPDNWLRTRPGLEGNVWYEIPLDAALRELAPAGGEDRVLMVPRAAARGSFWFNGERLETGAGEGYTRLQTLRMTLPVHAMRARGNVVVVRLEGSGESRDGLSAVTLGTPEGIYRPYMLRHLAQTVVPQLMLFLLVGATFATLSLWLKTRQRAHLLFLLLCASSLPRASAVMRPGAAAPTEVAMTVIAITSLLSSALVALLVLDFLGARGRFWDNYRRLLLIAVGALGAVAVAWAIFGLLTPRVFALLITPLLALMMVGLLAQIRAAFLDPRALHITIAVSLVAWTVTVAHDFATLADYNAFDSILWSPCAALAVFLTLVWRTIAGLALARGSADAEVHSAVSRAAGEHGRALEQLRIEYDRKKENERNAVIAAERTRLLHDLHDGMGSQLITALRMTRREDVPRDDVARVIEDALDDMRLIIDSLDLEERDLLPLLGNLRYRLEPRLHAIGIALAWEVEPIPELDYLTPETGLAIVRIVQEAVNNAVRHGAATAITVRAAATAQAVELSVTDNGHGFDTERSFETGAKHRGLNAMRARAAKLGGTLNIVSGADGTRVELKLPLRLEQPGA